MTRELGEALIGRTRFGKARKQFSEAQKYGTWKKLKTGVSPETESYRRKILKSHCKINDYKGIFATPTLDYSPAKSPNNETAYVLTATT